MAITFGSLKHTYSGRLRKPLPKTKKYKPEFKPMEVEEPYRRDEKDYPSASLKGASCSVVDRDYAKNSRHTIAPAYNKGAYQVISSENIRDIGR